MGVLRGDLRPWQRPRLGPMQPPGAPLLCKHPLECVSSHHPLQVLHTATLASARLDMKAKRRELLAAMRAMPDYTMKLSWRLGSAVPGLGMLLRRYAPADTYTLWKVGQLQALSGLGHDGALRHAKLLQPRPGFLGGCLHAPARAATPVHHGLPGGCRNRTPCLHPTQVGDRLRVDGTLMGIDTKSVSLIPEWKRGHFSLIMDGSACSSGGAPPEGSGMDSTGAPASGGVSREAATCSDSGAGAGASCADGDCSSNGDTAERPSEAGSGRAPRLLFLHHVKQRWVDLGVDKKSMKAEEVAALEDELLLALER
jgi:hypothetical protein